MKSKIKTIIIILLLLVLGIGIFLIYQEKTTETNPDGKKFKEEYESLNQKKTKTGKTYLSLTIDENNPITYIDTSEAIDILENQTAVIYFGFPECPWCRNLVPVLLESIKDTEYQNIYYCNALKERDIKTLDDNGNIITEQEGSANYYKIVDILKDKLDTYDGLNDDSIKRLYFPTVVFVKNGKIEKVKSGTVESQKDPYKALTKSQKKELKQELEEAILNLQDNTCNDDSKC